MSDVIDAVRPRHNAVRPRDVVPNNEYRFLGRVIFCAGQCFHEREDGRVEALTALFLDTFLQGGSNIEANNQRILITLEE